MATFQQSLSIVVFWSNAEFWAIISNFSVLFFVFNNLTSYMQQTSKQQFRLPFYFFFEIIQLNWTMSCLFNPK